VTDDKRVELEVQEQKFVEAEKARFAEKLRAALDSIKVEKDAALCFEDQVQLRAHIKAFFRREYGEQVSVLFGPTDKDAMTMTIQAYTRPRTIRVSVHL